MATPATPSQQRLLRIEIERLKSLSDVTIDFDGHPLTSIMGTNCCGKTTVLHALACSYEPLPETNRQGYKFPQFFKPNTDSLWQGSKFTLVHEYRIGPTHHSDQRTEFAKAQDRWTPRYEKRPQRDVRMLMIKDSVPEVETFGLNTMVHYDKTDLTDTVNVDVRNAAGQVLNMAS